MARLRSAFAVLAIMVWLVLGGLYLRLVVYPVVYLRLGKRVAVVSAYMRGMSRVIMALLRAGGASVRRRGVVPTDRPVVVLMNHQSLTDICTASLLARPYAPWFVTRRRYQYGIPAVSPCLRALGCPVIDPHDRAAALAVLRQAAQAQEHGILIFPEGHRTLDGEIRPFRAAGLLTVLHERPTPVYLIVTDGFWSTRRLVDFVFNVRKIVGRSEVLGPFDPPTEEEELPGFAERMRQAMVEHLARMRRDHAAP